SHEFHVLADSGEDQIVFSDTSDYAANLEMATALAPAGSAPAPAQTLTKVATPDVKTIDDVAAFLKVPVTSTVQTLIVLGDEDEQGNAQLVALVLRGDHTLNEIKAAKLAGVRSPLTFANDAQIQAVLGCTPGSIGPAGPGIPVLVDRDAAQLSDFV